MLDAGVPIHKVRDWVGHKNIATTSIYANTTLSHLNDARAIFERRPAPALETGAPLAQASNSEDGSPVAGDQTGEYH
jgi:hypothetical protein